MPFADQGNSDACRTAIAIRSARAGDACHGQDYAGEEEVEQQGRSHSVPQRTETTIESSESFNP